MVEPYIYQKKNSIPDRLCSDIITMYELENIKYDGLTVGGVQKDIKDTTDMVIPKKDIKWNKIETLLLNELKKGLEEYLKNIYSVEYSKDKNGIEKYTIFDESMLHIDIFQVQKYDKQQGKYIYHNDFFAQHDLKRCRVITYLWYLNDVEEGGETEFWGGSYNVKPETGKLILFPACWTYPHRGKMPISSNKYIITGWFYEKQSNNGEL